MGRFVAVVVVSVLAWMALVIVGHLFAGVPLDRPLFIAAAVMACVVGAMGLASREGRE